MERLKIIVLFVVVSVANLAVATKGNSVLGEGEISLEDIIMNTENYMGERNVTFAIVNITLRPDPDGMLTKTYYLVYIVDSYNFRTPFVISEDDYQDYGLYIGEWVAFKLIGVRGQELMLPPDRLITNVLAGKTMDPYSRQYYRVFIFLPDAAVIFKVDLNRDGNVDILDAIMLARAFGSKPGSPNWNSDADINGDSAVDIYDAITLADNYGKAV